MGKKEIKKVLYKQDFSFIEEGENLRNLVLLKEI